jgi:hypothetical protein
MHESGKGRKREREREREEEKESAAHRVLAGTSAQSQELALLATRRPLVLLLLVCTEGGPAPASRRPAAARLAPRRHALHVLLVAHGLKQTFPKALQLTAHHRRDLRLELRLEGLVEVALHGPAVLQRRLDALRDSCPNGTGELRVGLEAVNELVYQLRDLVVALVLLILGCIRGVVALAIELVPGEFVAGHGWWWCGWRCSRSSLAVGTTRRCARSCGCPRGRPSLRGTGGVEWGEHTKSGKRTGRAREARDGRVQSARLQAADGAR